MTHASSEFLFYHFHLFIIINSILMPDNLYADVHTYLQFFQHTIEYKLTLGTAVPGRRCRFAQTTARVSSVIRGTAPAAAVGGVSRLSDVTAAQCTGCLLNMGSSIGSWCLPSGELGPVRTTFRQGAGAAVQTLGPPQQQSVHFHGGHSTPLHSTPFLPQLSCKQFVTTCYISYTMNISTRFLRAKHWVHRRTDSMRFH